MKKRPRLENLPKRYTSTNKAKQKHSALAYLAKQFFLVSTRTDICNAFFEHKDTDQMHHSSTAYNAGASRAIGHIIITRRCFWEVEK